jgi:hypothetical protein
VGFPQVRNPATRVLLIAHSRLTKEESDSNLHMRDVSAVAVERINAMLKEGERLRTCVCGSSGARTSNSRFYDWDETFTLQIVLLSCNLPKSYFLGLLQQGTKPRA